MLGKVAETPDGPDYVTPRVPLRTKTELQPDSDDSKAGNNTSRLN